MTHFLRPSIDVRMVWLVLSVLGLPQSGTAQGPGDPCLMCHSMPAMFETTGDPDRFVVTHESLSGSAHGDLGLSCSSCHQNMEFPHPEGAKATCSPCHSGIETEFAESLHGYALARGTIGPQTAPPVMGPIRSSPAPTPDPKPTRFDFRTRAARVMGKWDF